jgi:hypothetical protein
MTNFKNQAHKSLIQCIHSPHNFRPTIKPYKQVFITPFFNDYDNGDFTFVHAPLADPDLSKPLQSISESGDSALFMAVLESGITYFPRNITSFKGTKLALIGDTHHGHRPITTIIDYLLSPASSYDYVYIPPFGQPSHILHFYWCGVSNVDIYPRSLPFLRGIKQNSSRRRGVVYIGNSQSPFHVRRSRIIAILEKALSGTDVPFLVYPYVSAEDWVSLLAEHEIAIYASLNSQPSQQLHANIAAGTLCLADRLSVSTGIDHLYRIGVHYDTYSSPSDLIDKVRFYFLNQEKSNLISGLGQVQASRVNLLEEDPMSLAELAIRRSTEIPARDRHPAFRFSLPDPVLFRYQLEIYELIQEMHRIYESIHVVIADNTLDLLHFLFSLETLSRLRVSLISDSIRTLDTASLMLTAAFQGFNLELSSNIDPQSLGKYSNPDMTIVVLGQIEQSKIMKLIDLSTQTIFIVFSKELFTCHSIAKVLMENLLRVNSTQEIVSVANQWQKKGHLWKEYGAVLEGLPIHVNENIPTNYPVFLSRS